MLLPFWSVYVSYRGVRTVFDVRRAPALLWFLVLSGFIYFVMFGGMAAIGFAATLAEPPNLRKTSLYQGPTMRFEYPGNWWIDNDHPQFNARTNVRVEPVHDAYLIIMAYPFDQSVEEELSVTIADLQQNAEN